MADFFKDLERALTDVVDNVSKKAGDTIDAQKIKMDIRSLQRASERDYAEIGKIIYNKFQAGEVSDVDCIALCEAIEKREAEIRKKEEDAQRI